MDEWKGSVEALGITQQVGGGLFAPDREFWNHRRVLVTGHSGFKGTWLTAWLHHLGADVAGLSLDRPSSPNMFDAVAGEELCHDTTGDICDRTAVDRTVQKFTPEVVFHLAAQPIVRVSYADPLSTLQVNIQGTANVLEACRNLSDCRAIVICTSDKCYDNQGLARPFVESDRLGGYDPYSVSKACAELVTSAYRSSFFNEAKHDTHGVAVATVRAGNVIGGGDWGADRLIPDAARAFSSGEVLSIRNPSALRPWQYVVDSLSGYLSIAHALVENGRAYSGAWNFGPLDSTGWSVLKVADAFTSAWGGQASLQNDENRDEPHEQEVLRLNTDKARVELGWAPRVDVAAALDRSAEWYKAFYAGSTPDVLRALTLGEIVSNMTTPPLSI